MQAATSPARFGDLLRGWRKRRSVSQLELALEADVSARHVSFVETGRSTPSREIIVRLAEALDVPLRKRNELLLAAGYAPLYLARPLETDELEPVRSALDRFLRAHEPYPALVVDRQHNLVAANDALGVITADCAPWLLEPPANAIRIALHPQGLAPTTGNLGEWSAHLLARLRRELAATADPALRTLLEEVSHYPGVDPHPPDVAGSSEIAIPLRLHRRDRELSFLSTISTFGTAVDITVAELSIEAFYPANAVTATHLLEAIT